MQRGWQAQHMLSLDGYRNSCTVIDLLSKCYQAVAEGNSCATHWPKATLVRHVVLGLLACFRFPTCRSVGLDANRCAKSALQLHQMTALSTSYLTLTF